MLDAHQVIALAGVGDLGRYVCEELHASPDFDVIVLTRAVSHHPLISTKKKRSVSLQLAVIHLVYLLKSSAYSTAMVQEQANQHLHNRLHNRFRSIGARIHKSNHIDLFHRRLQC